MKCPKCGSENTVDITGDELRKLHLLYWVCFDCKEEYETGWDIDIEVRPDILENYIKYEDKIKTHIKKCADLIFIKDERLPDDVIEFRHPKTNELIRKVMNISNNGIVI